MQEVLSLVLLSLPLIPDSPQRSQDPETLSPPPAVLAPAPIPERLAQDTVKKRRRVDAIEYSDFYGTRLTIHRVLSWSILPLFAMQYASGSQLLEHGSAAPDWAQELHGPTAAVVAGVFTVNTVTGLWNLWDARKDPNGRARRYIHSALMLTASAGFVYAGSLADEAESSAEMRDKHQAVALTSIGLSTASWLMMLIWKD
jgi:hypothetical protein